MSDRLDEERDLLAGFLGADPSGARELLRQFGPGLLQTALRFLDRDEAEACLRRTFRIARRSLKVPTREHSLGAQLRRILLIEAVRRLKSRPADRAALARLLPSFDAADRRIAAEGQGPLEGTLEELLSSKEHRGLMRHVIGQLPDTHRAAFLLHDVEGLSPEESSEILGTTPLALRALLHEARSALGALLSRPPPSEDPTG